MPILVLELGEKLILKYRKFIFQRQLKILGDIECISHFS